MVITKQIPLDDWNMMRSLCSGIKYYTKRKDPKFEPALTRFRELYDQYKNKYREVGNVKVA